jgi:hypothetical protein
VLTFNSDMDPASVQNPNNYQIMVPGRRLIPVVSATYDACTRTVALKPRTRINLHYPFYLTAIGDGPTGLADTSGGRLDGAVTGRPGSNYGARIVWFGPGKPVDPALNSSLRSRHAPTPAYSAHHPGHGHV